MNSKLTFGAVALALTMAALGFGAAAYWRHSRDASPAGLTTGTLILPRRPLPAFSLLDQRGAAFTPHSLEGHWSMLYFGYTNCPDLCPTTLTSLAAMQKSLSAAGIRNRPLVVFVSADARRDTPAVLARYVPFFDPAFVGVTAATQADIESFARNLGVAILIGPQSGGAYTVDHSSAVFVTAPDGTLAAVLTGPHSAQSLSEDFRRILAAGS